MPRTKSIFRSKTFWLNLVGAFTLLVPGLPIASATIGLIMTGLNIANRLLTDQPVHVVAPPE